MRQARRQETASVATYSILPCGTTPETWVIERTANYMGLAEPLLIFDTLQQAEEALATVLAKQGRSES
jgi:hypothetical protein